MLKILSPEVQKFIRDHQHDDEKELILKNKNIHGVPAVSIAEQIAGRRKAKEKIPIYYNGNNIIYPPGINLEQSSSEHTAKFKASLPFADSRNIVDLTGGFGVDSFFFSKVFSSVDYIEPDEKLLEISKHNHGQLNAANIRYHNTNAETFLNALSYHVDLIYIDPSRRSENKKVFTFSNSEPNIILLLGQMFEKTNNVLIKASPLLDIKQGLKELLFVKQVYIISVDNDCKELLFFCEKFFKGEALIHAVNISKDNKASFEFLFSEESKLENRFRDPMTYLYEPNASILKAGAFKSIPAQFEVDKIQSSTHLYTSEKLIQHFPGRIFKIEAHLKPDPKNVRSFFPEGKANVTTRNYPLSVEELKKKTGLKDGGEKFLIGFSGTKKKFLVGASRIK